MSFIPPGSCPNCGADVPRDALCCPECGSDEKSGWGDDTYLDGIDLPESENERADEAERLRERELGVRSSRGWKGWFTAALILVLLLSLVRVFVWH